MTQAEKNHLSKVAESGCQLCRHLGMGHTPAEIHHPRFSEGIAQRASHFLAIGLCTEHHRGQSGLHGLGTREFERRYKINEPALLALTIESIG
jgi:hypothetical protein